jgi:poly-gamma-glutamate synthesis protein (capsule biosynthesis protein)
MSRIHILIGGDLCPVNRYQDLFQHGNQEAILGPLAERALQADLFIANLECPFIRQPSPILKTGPVLGVPLSCARGLATIGLNAVGIANNHIMDHGAAGLAATMEACEANGVATFGAGVSLAEAQRILIQDVKGLRVGMLAMAEREWSIASRSSPGANPLDLIEFVRQMKEHRKRVDFLVVLLHAGCEGYELPSPGLQKVCRFLVEEGADVVTCQHSHCVGSHETYRGRPIVYGQGNFIFDYDSHGYKGREGVFIDLQVQASGETSFKLVPFVRQASKAGLAALEAAEEARFMASLEARSAILADEDMVESAWKDYSRDRKLSLLDVVLDHGRVMRRLNRKGRILDLRGPRYYKNLLSIVQNESMVETLNTLLRDSLK